MTAKIIAVANMKGGVGKTATVVSLAEAFAAGGARVLVIDLDAQANASVCIAGDMTLARLMERRATVEGFLDDQLLGRKRLSLSDCIATNISGVTHLGMPLAVSLLPSSPELRSFEHRLLHDLTQRSMSWANIVNGLFSTVSTQLQAARKEHDVILIDCAPGISVLTEVSIRLADLVIVPTIADFLSTFGLQNFCATLASRALTRKILRTSGLPHVLITRRRQVINQNATARLLRNEMEAEQPTFVVFETEIPETVAVAEALGEVKKKNPTFTQKWGPLISPLLSDLTHEIGDVLDAQRG
jgi:cellulose biosynthesis protein BcsQ